MSLSAHEPAAAAQLDTFSSSDEAAPRSEKRKHEEEPAQDKRKAKRRKAKNAKKAIDDDNLDADLGVNHAIAHMDSRLMADHLAQRSKKFQPDLSLVELEDCYIPEKAMLDTTSWEKPRTHDNLPDYLEQFAGPKRKKKGHKLSDAPKEKGHPHTLVIAGAGLRAADLVRKLRRFQTKEAMIAKLFAKHIKIKEAIETMKKSRVSIGVGTPQRILDLLEDGALSAEHLERIVVDASHIDLKKRGILDMQEMLIPLIRLLGRSELKARYGASEGNVQLLFF